MPILLADAVAMADLAPIFSSVGSIGFAVWFGGYTAMYLLPGMQKAHIDAVDKITGKHADTIRQLVEEMKEQREAFDRWRATPRG